MYLYCDVYKIKGGWYRMVGWYIEENGAMVHGAMINDFCFFVVVIVVVALRF